MFKGVIKNKKAVVIILMAVFLIFVFGFFNYETYYSEDDMSFGKCNSMIISVNGQLTTYIPERSNEDWDDTVSSEEVTDALRIAKNEDSIKAVILYVDSGGGDIVAGEEIANALKNIGKPSIAVIRGLGASGAYWASTGADKIYASRVSEVGSIAVTASYLDDSRKNDRDGYQYTELSSGKFKNLGDPSRPLTSEERNIIMSDIKKMHNIFVRDVATNRGLEVSEVEKLANGLTYIGNDALTYGLIDEIGDLDSATKYLEGILGEKVEYCWY